MNLKKCCNGGRLRSSFKKAFSKRIKGTSSETEFWLRLQIFTIEPFNANLNFQANRKDYEHFQLLRMKEWCFILQRTNRKKPSLQILVIMMKFIKQNPLRDRSQSIKPNNRFLLLLFLYLGKFHKLLL